MAARVPKGLSVLLFSPLEGIDPPGGDTSYTADLLNDPPEGVRYTTYHEAIERGDLRIRGRKPWRFGGSMLDVWLFLLRSIEVLLRRSGLMYREPTWYVTIEHGRFDLVHQHLFSVRQLGSHVPVVSSAGYPLEVLYEQQSGWSRRRCRIATELEALYSRVVGIHNPGFRGSAGSVMTVYTEAFRDWLVDRGQPREQIWLLGTATAKGEMVDRPPPGPPTIGFVGREFDRKGGQLVVDAFHRLSTAIPELRLVVRTRQEDLARLELDDPRIDAQPACSRNELRHGVLPRLDLLVLPTKADCGAPYTVLEALQVGTPVVISDSPWIDSRLTGPAAHRCAPDVESLCDVVAPLLAHNQRGTASNAAKELWEREFSTTARNPVLADMYARAVGNRVEEHG